MEQDTAKYTSDYCRGFIIEHLVYQKRCYGCPGDCPCDKETLPYELGNANIYIKPIRDEFQKMVDEGYFEPVVFYKPTQKAIDLKHS